MNNEKNNNEKVNYEKKIEETERRDLAWRQH